MDELSPVVPLQAGHFFAELLSRSRLGSKMMVTWDLASNTLAVPAKKMLEIAMKLAIEKESEKW